MIRIVSRNEYFGGLSDILILERESDLQMIVGALCIHEVNLERYFLTDSSPISFVSFQVFFK